MRPLILAFLLWLVPGVALSAPSPSAAPGPDLTPPAASQLDGAFRYLEPQEAHRLRAVGWIGAYLGLQLGVYVLKGSPTAAQYEERFTPLDKLQADGWSLDANSMRTNFVAHPIMGAVMYQMARGSRLPAWEAALWSVAGSTAWELIEYQELGSLNDLLVTPAGGVALGEPLFQLSAHLDRLPRSSGRELLAWVLSPWKKLDDWVDGAHLARGDPQDALGLRAWGELAWARAPGWERAQLAGGLAWWLVRDPAYGAEGRGRRTYLAGEVTGFSTSLALSADALDDLRLESWALLAATYARDLDAERRGADLLVGAGVALDLRRHDWVHSGPADALGLVHVPRLHGAARWFAGDLRLAAGLDASLAFGGVRSFALDRAPSSVPPEALPTVHQGYQYHFAVGPALHPVLEARWGGASLEASWRGDWLWPVLEPDPTPGAHPTAQLEDRWSEALLRIAWRSGGGLELGLQGEQRNRWSRADASTWRTEEQRLALTVGLADGW